MGSKQKIYLPAQFAVNGQVLGNLVQQLWRPEDYAQAEVRSFSKGRVSGKLVTRDDGIKTLVVAREVTPLAGMDEVLFVPCEGGSAEMTALRTRGDKVRWLKPESADIANDTLAIRQDRCSHVRACWRDQFFFREEQDEKEKFVHGLRPPQIGALHAALAHWKVTNEPATIVMPTGTGKTETMLALLVCQRLERLLVVVPTDALRQQTADKFLTLGVLKRFGVVGPAALYPVVGTLEHRLRTPDEVEAYFRCCNVVVTTMSVVSGCTEKIQRKMAELCSHLFIDEAHHVTAPTWDKFRHFFLQKTILQFTATPFRNDGKLVDGKIIFNYPLHKAQQEGYFKPIHFSPVKEYRFERSDETIAQKAVEQLDKDLSGNLDHVVMARTSDIDRAKQVHKIYLQHAAKHSPLLIHSKMSEAELRQAIQKLRRGKSRIIVCVGMLGEGFDLPKLKIAALHDVHKSLAVTLQFTGRFTRSQANIGDATVIANIANAEVEESLRELYAQDADWNSLLPRLSGGRTLREEQRLKFLDHFTDEPTEIPLQNVFPKMSAIAYRTQCNDWHPEKVHDVVKAIRFYAGPTINHLDRVLLFVTREHEPISWGSVKDIYNRVWDLYLVYWDKDQKLLFIHSSNNASQHDKLAEALAGPDVKRIRGEQVFRSLHGIDYLVLMNLGLNHPLSYATRFTMHVGPDIRQTLTDAFLQDKTKSNIFGWGYEKGDKTSVGCSYRGRIWSYKVAKDISEWVEWCHAIGTKLNNDAISVEEILKHVIIPTQISARPALVPLTIEWPEEILQRSEQTIELNVAGEVVPFFEAEMELVGHTRHGPLQFRIFAKTKSVVYEIKFRANRVEYVPADSETVEILTSRKCKSLSEWFQEESPLIRFENGAWLTHNDLYEIPHGAHTPFDRQRIEAWNWAGIDLRKESQTAAKFHDSIQYHVIQELISQDHSPRYDVVFDDDDAREAADIVAIKVAKERLLIHFFHCKYSKKEGAGARVEDLYAVCGQAQRSAYWKHADTTTLFEHLCNRERSRLQRHKATRFERGDFAKLDEISRRAPFLIHDFKVFIVQPGLSKSQVKAEQLDLLAGTEVYLQTRTIEFGVIASL